MRIRGQLLAAALLAGAAGTASAEILTLNYSSGFHNRAWLTGGSNGSSLNVVYGDGSNAGISPHNKCVDGNPVGTQIFCEQLQAGTNPKGGISGVPGYAGPFVVPGNNGTYQTNTVQGANPSAGYLGSLSWDTAQTFLYTDQVTSVSETWNVITGGSLVWTGTVGFEVVVAASVTSGNVGGSFFDYSFGNGSIALTGATAGVRTSTAKCDLGIAGQTVVGSLLCGFANPASGFNYSNSGTSTNLSQNYTKPVNWTGIRDNGDGTVDLLMWGNKYTTKGSGNNLQERIQLSGSVVPVPAAVWLFGSGLGLLAFARRKMAA